MRWGTVSDGSAASGSEPALMPMRMGTPRSFAAFTTAVTFSGSLILPGLRRRPSTPALIDSKARL